MLLSVTIDKVREVAKKVFINGRAIKRGVGVKGRPLTSNKTKNSSDCHKARGEEG